MTEKCKPSPSFRESISKAPEFTEPFIANIKFLGRQEWPFQEIKPDRNSFTEKVVFEAKSPFSEDEERDPVFVRVSYEEPYGLKAKKTIVLRKFSDSKLLMEAGEIKYSFGEVDIVIAAIPSTIFATEEIFNNPENFKPTINVIAGDKSIPPMAYVEYHSSSRIPIHAEFPYADFQEALNGEVEKREEHNSSGLSYEKTYFQWEQFLGAKVGVARYDDPVRPDLLNCYRWVTKINNSEPVQLEGSPYKEKISWSRGLWQWGSGRLRFSRINSETGESWMFSVPEWIDKHDFHRDIQQYSLMDFFGKYPVVFCVKKKGEDKKWFSTHFTRDLAR